ncbi:MAG TPA: hypothetical protein VI461_13265 [Chitinophagaceae bacterium]|nr:hypothetical protein [Chitinophagaceae bacterium]
MRKSALVAAMAAIALGTFATSGDGKNKSTGSSKKSLLSLKSSMKPGSFSLQNSYNFRGSQVIGAQDNKYINLNTTVTYQTGHTSYIVPLKKKVVLKDKIVFNPNAATRR